MAGALVSGARRQILFEGRSVQCGVITIPAQQNVSTPPTPPVYSSLQICFNFLHLTLLHCTLLFYHSSFPPSFPHLFITPLIYSSLPSCILHSQPTNCRRPFRVSSTVSTSVRPLHNGDSQFLLILPFLFFYSCCQKIYFLLKPFVTDLRGQSQRGVPQ